MNSLAGYAPRTALEAADLERVRSIDGDPWSRATTLHITGSALIVHPPTRRVLLRWHARQQSWLQVGGHGDPGETDPLEVALREGREETGLPDLQPWPAPAIVHVVIVPVPPPTTSPRTSMPTSATSSPPRRPTRSPRRTRRPGCAG